MHILIAEDDRRLLTSISRGLIEASHTVDQAANGPDALKCAKSNKHDVIILDVLLPGQDGMAVCQTIRGWGSRVPILMLTALDGVEHRIAGLDSGADDYLTKPFDFGELLARLRALTRRRDNRAPSQIVVGDLAIDVHRRTVCLAGRDIALTAKEYSFLLYLAQNAGRVVSRTELMTHVWDDKGNSFSNIIDVYASRLRRKIDRPGVPTLLTTMRGSGFVLESPSPERGADPTPPLGSARLV